MPIFPRTPRPNNTKEEMGTITRHGLLAHGVKPNPFVSPASYMGHSGIESVKGQTNIEAMCKSWTNKQIALATEDNFIRLSPNTPLAILLDQMNKGRRPSDCLPTAVYSHAVGAKKNYNRTAEKSYIVLRTGNSTPRKRRSNSAPPRKRSSSQQLSPTSQVDSEILSPKELPATDINTDMKKREDYFLRKAYDNAVKRLETESELSGGYSTTSNYSEDAQEEIHPDKIRNAVEALIRNSANMNSDELANAIANVLDVDLKKSTKKTKRTKSRTKNRAATAKIAGAKSFDRKEQQLEEEIHALDARLSDIQSQQSLSNCWSADDEGSLAEQNIPVSRQFETLEDEIETTIRGLEAEIQNEMTDSRKMKPKNKLEVADEDEEESKDEEAVSHYVKRKQSFSPVVNAVREIMDELASPRHRSKSSNKNRQKAIH